MMPPKTTPNSNASLKMLLLINTHKRELIKTNKMTKKSLSNSLAKLRSYNKAKKILSWINYICSYAKEQGANSN